MPFCGRPSLGVSSILHYFRELIKNVYIQVDSTDLKLFHNFSPDVIYLFLFIHLSLLSTGRGVAWRLTLFKIRHLVCIGSCITYTRLQITLICPRWTFGKLLIPGLAYCISITLINKTSSYFKMLCVWIFRQLCFFLTLCWQF